MPFCLCDSPASFQRLMQHIFNDIFNDAVFKILLVYLDDIIIYSKTWDEHVDWLNAVLTRLREHSQKLNPKKCNFRMEISYLGYSVSATGVSTSQYKIKGVQE